MFVCLKTSFVSFSFLSFPLQPIHLLSRPSAQTCSLLVPDQLSQTFKTTSKMFEFLDTVDRGLPSERNKQGIPVRPSVSLPTSRNNSTTSIDSLQSLRSEPGWMTSMNGVDRSRATSTSSQTSNKSGSSGAFSKFFKSKKDKKDTERVVITAQHAAAVRAKLARDSRFDKYRKAVANKDKKTTPRVVGILSTQHLTAEQQELRHPHSGPPALSAAGDKVDMPVLARIVSGDEADEADQWERMRDEWKESTIPDVQIQQVIEGEGLESGSSSGTSTPQSREIELVTVPPSKVVEREGVRLLAVADKALNLRPKPVRRHTPIGGRYTKDEHGVWKK